MTTFLKRALVLVFVATACDGSRTVRPVSTDMSGPAGYDPDDKDHDGYTPAMGDCNDANPLVGPGSVELPGNSIDDDCNGKIDEALAGCDGAAAGGKDPMQLAAAIGLCDPRFLVKAEVVGPSDPRARLATARFGSIPPLEGGAMALLSTGIAGDNKTAGWVLPQVGTNLDANNTAQNPDLTVPGVTGCSSSQPATVNDYTEIALTLHVPANVNSLEFQFQFFSAEYPEFVCFPYNDEFLVELEQKGEPAHNIAFDSMMNPITVNNGYFTVCQNDAGKPQTQHCTKSIDGLSGTGYEVTQLGRPIGGSTAWLHTSAPVRPGQDLRLRFIIFDEADHIYDSAVLIDNFIWSPNVISAPVTVP